MKVFGNVIAFTFLGFGKAFEFVFRRSGARLGQHSVTSARIRARPGPARPADRVVESHHVLSGRLMDAPTGRLHPSSRHRVPPWVPPSPE